MACGVLYVLKKYDEKYTGLNYMYNTHTGIFCINSHDTFFKCEIQRRLNLSIFRLRINMNGTQWLTTLP